MAPKARVALTFLLVLLAVLLWGVSQLPLQYDRGALGGSERLFAAGLFLLAIVINLLGAVKPRKRPHSESQDYYVHFDEAGHHPQPPRYAQPHHPAGHTAGHPPHAGHHGPPAQSDPLHDRRH